MTRRPSTLDLALSSVLGGASTSVDIAADLGVSVEHAGTILWKLRREGLLRLTGRRVPTSTGRGGQPMLVYAPVL